MENNKTKRSISRQQFLQQTAMAGAAVLLANLESFALASFFMPWFQENALEKIYRMLK